MCTVMAWWDVSWWIAVNFTFGKARSGSLKPLPVNSHFIGSMLFLMSGVFYWMPTAYPDRHYTFDSLVAGGVTSAIGGTMFAVGGVLLVVEAVNAEQSGCFGWALHHMGHRAKIHEIEAERSNSSEVDENAIAKSQAYSFKPKMEHCSHHHQRQKQRRAALPEPDAARPWMWWPPHHELMTHYIFEIGFLANFVMFVGAIIFWITSEHSPLPVFVQLISSADNLKGILSLPGVFNNLSEGVIKGIYYMTYVVGSVFFVTASALYILEAQKKWYLASPYNVGWWIAIWNMVGSIGWLYAACLGYCTKSWCVYQADLTLIWASAAFLIASALLWYEAMEKWPIRIEHRW